MKRLAVARLWHEGNSFSPSRTTLADFQRREWVEGDAARDFYRGTATELGAAAAFADDNPDWNVAFLRCAAAPPGGPVEESAFAAIRARLLEGLRAARWDAVYLSLHGALVTELRPTAELDLLRDVRAAIGRTPLAVSFDLHANIGAPLLGLVDVATGYKTYPHTDMDATGAKALRLLVDCVEGRSKPVGAIAKLPAILASFNMRTTDGPMAEIVALARSWESRPGILDATVFGGFAYGDCPHAGPAALVHADADRGLAEACAADLIAALAARRDRFTVQLPDAAQGLRRALAMPPGLVAVVDPADNPLSGGIGDTPALFRALLDLGSAEPTVFAFFHDPEIVELAHERGVGASLDCRLGGRVTAHFGAPVPVTARVLRLTDGRFRNSGPMETGLTVDLGRTALLEIGSIQVIITGTCQSPNDPGYFALHGIDLARVRLLCVKAKNHFRAAFGPLCRAIIDVDTPGPASLDLRHLPFRYVPPAVRPSMRP